MTIRVRRRILEAARRPEENGIVPHSADHPEVYRQRSGGIILPEDADWIESTQALRQAYIEHPDLDLAAAGRQAGAQ
jgi:phthalate 4,5-dioxygenase oxygenase subunit